MTHRDELVGQIGHDPLGAAVELGGNRFDQRRDLRNSHACSGVMMPHRGPICNRPTRQRVASAGAASRLTSVSITATDLTKVRQRSKGLREYFAAIAVCRRKDRLRKARPWPRRPRIR